jgi:hypothetical protein
MDGRAPVTGGSALLFERHLAGLVVDEDERPGPFGLLTWKIHDGCLWNGGTHGLRRLNANGGLKAENDDLVFCQFAIWFHAPGDRRAGSLDRYLINGHGPAVA